MRIHTLRRAAQELRVSTDFLLGLTNTPTPAAQLERQLSALRRRRRRKEHAQTPACADARRLPQRTNLQPADAFPGTGSQWLAARVPITTAPAVTRVRPHLQEGREQRASQKRGWQAPQVKTHNGPQANNCGG
jgi:hypothetical protein